MSKRKLRKATPEDYTKAQELGVALAKRTEPSGLPGDFLACLSVDAECNEWALGFCLADRYLVVDAMAEAFGAERVRQGGEL